MTDTSDRTGTQDQGGVWCPWVVARESGFEVNQPDGKVGLVQVDTKQFQVTHAFRFNNDDVKSMLVNRLVRKGVDENEAIARVEDAALFTLSEDPTDLASIPAFLRWFETSYGLHTLAAIIHDDLIGKAPNSGVLRSDALSDRFFREMMKAAGVKWFKRSIMWAAVVIRSRWAVGGFRRAAVVFWLLLACAGIGALGWTSVAAAVGGDTPWNTAQLVLFVVLLPLPAALLWGKQWWAGIIASLTAVWILPPAVFAGIGYGVYWLLEWTTKPIRAAVGRIRR